MIFWFCRIFNIEDIQKYIGVKWNEYIYIGISLEIFGD